MKKILLILILCLAFTLPVHAAVLFSDGFEGGNTNAWDSETDTENDLTVTEGSALHGTYGLAGVIDDITIMYVQDDTPSAETRYRFRFYFRHNNPNMANGNRISIFNDTGTTVLYINMKYWATPKYTMYLTVITDSATTSGTAGIDLDNTSHYIEVDWKASSAPDADDGAASIWVDGGAPQTISGIDNDEKVINSIQFGLPGTITAGVTGTVYFDDFVSNDDGTEIGEYSAFPLAKFGNVAITKWNNIEISKWNDQ